MEEDESRIKADLERRGRFLRYEDSIKQSTEVIKSDDAVRALRAPAAAQPQDLPLPVRRGASQPQTRM